MKKNRTRFFIQAFIPFFALLLLYILLDPFLMLRNYGSFYENGKPAFVDRNNDYVSTSTYDSQKSKYNYNSFIFGNSRSRYFMVKDWKLHLDTTASCYHFDASNETLYGILKKVEYVNQYTKVKNVLLILDKEILSVTKPQTYSYLFYLSPQLENYRNAYGFYLSGFKTFVNPKFFVAYIDLSLFGEIRPYMRYFSVFNENVRNYNLQYNETSWPDKEKLLKSGNYYSNERIKQFYVRSDIQIFDDKCIKDEQILQLKSIAKVFRDNSTKFKIIISPKYDQKKLSNSDLLVLEQIFGSGNVFDFSGKNEFTENYTNYWDVNHYNEVVAKNILNEIY